MPSPNAFDHATLAQHRAPDVVADLARSTTVEPDGLRRGDHCGDAGGADHVVLATGHYRNGILLAPITAQAVAELIATGRPTFDLTPFSVGRFAPG